MAPARKSAEQTFDRPGGIARPAAAGQSRHVNAAPSSDRSAFDWRKRSEDLFDEADAAKNPIGREAARRKATAALNIAESMEHSAQIARLDSRSSQE